MFGDFHFEAGVRYEVVYEQESANYRWLRYRFVGTYLGPNYMDEPQFSMRPAAGTGHLDRHARIINIAPTDREHHAPVRDKS